MNAKTQSRRGEPSESETGDPIRRRPMKCN